MTRSRLVAMAAAVVVVIGCVVGLLVVRQDRAEQGGRASTPSSKPSPRPDPPAAADPASATVEDGKSTTASVGDLKVTLPAGAATAGATLALSEQRDGPPLRLEGPVYDIALDDELTAPATIELAFDRSLLPDGEDPVLYTWVEDTSRWLPQAATLNDDTLTAQTMHFSWWSLGRPNWILGQITGDRTRPPTCADGLPSWAMGDFIRQDDLNAAVLSCAEDGGQTARVKLKANRGDPIIVEFSHPPTVVGGSDQSRWMTEVLQQRWPKRAFIEARAELVVEFTQPARASVIEAKRWGGDGARYATTALVMFLEEVIGGAKGKLPQLYRAATCIFDAKQFGSGTDDAFAGVGQSLGFLSSCIEPQLENFRATGVITGKEFARLNQAFALWKFADQFNKLMDVMVIDRDDTAPYFGIGTRLPKPDAPTLGDGRYGPYRVGMTIADAEAMPWSLREVESCAALLGFDDEVEQRTFYVEGAPEEVDITLDFFDGTLTQILVAGDITFDNGFALNTDRQGLPEIAAAMTRSGWDVLVSDRFVDADYADGVTPEGWSFSMFAGQAVIVGVPYVAVCD